jgi:hypothetical protein
MINPYIGLQAGLDAAYDTYAFGREGDLTKGLTAAGGGTVGGLASAALTSRLLNNAPKKYKLAGAMIANFLGSTAGAELGIRGLERMRNTNLARVQAAQPLESVALQASPVSPQDSLSRG